MNYRLPDMSGNVNKTIGTIGVLAWTITNLICAGNDVSDTTWFAFNFFELVGFGLLLYIFEGMNFPDGFFD